MADQEESGPAVPKQEGKIINISVKDQLGGEVHFKIKNHTKFEKVFKAYCDKKSLDMEAVRFLFDGDRVQKEQTPEELEMEDGDTLDCVIRQMGGC